MIRGLHHHACRCRDSEETRKFYEDFLGLKLAGTLIQPGTHGQMLVVTYLGPRGCRLELRVQPAPGFQW